MILRIVALCTSIAALIVSIVTKEYICTKKDVECVNALIKVRNRDKFIAQQQKELDETKAKYTKLHTFELMVENLVYGKREPEEIVDRIKKELLSLR